MFLKKKRTYGPFSILLVVVTSFVLTVVYASYTGELFPDGLVMLGCGVTLVVVPFVLLVRFGDATVRWLGGVNVVFAAVLFTLLGGPTNSVLADHGVEPFRAVSRLVADGSARSHPITDIGLGMVEVLRALTLGAERRPVSEAELKPVPLEASIEDATARAGGSGVVVKLDPGETVEVPIATHGGLVTVGAIVNEDVPADFVFDTGAETTAITRALCRRLGLDPESAERRLFYTAGGPVEEPVVRLRSVRIDEAEVADLEVMVCTHCRQNLLGRDFQAHFVVGLDTQAGLLRLEPR